LRLQRATPVAHPRATSLRSGDELARIELHAYWRVLVIGRRFGGVAAFALEALLGLA
jgi:hypothetical protein